MIGHENDESHMPDSSMMVILDQIYDLVTCSTMAELIKPMGAGTYGQKPFWWFNSWWGAVIQNLPMA